MYLFYKDNTLKIQSQQRKKTDDITISFFSLVKRGHKSTFQCKNYLFLHNVEKLELMFWLEKLIFILGSIALLWHFTYFKWSAISGLSFLRGAGGPGNPCYGVQARNCKFRTSHSRAQSRTSNRKAWFHYPASLVRRF